MMPIDIADQTVDWLPPTGDHADPGFGCRALDADRDFHVRTIVDSVVAKDALVPREFSALADVAEHVLRFASDGDRSDRLQRAVEHCALIEIDLEPVLAVVVRAIEDVAIEQDAPGEHPEGFLRVIRTATAVVAQVYRQPHTRVPRRSETPQDVAAALLRGEVSPTLGLFGQIAIAGSYWLIAVRMRAGRALAPTRPGPRGTAGPATASALAELRSCFGPNAVALLADAGGSILVPADSGITRAELAAFIGRMGAATGKPVVAVALRSATDALAAADEQAHAALEVAERLSRPNRLYDFSEMAIDYQLTRPGPARDALAGVLEPIEELPDLLETLRAYLHHGQDRRRTARALHLHPNSIDYRLRRVYQLTATDGLDPAGLWKLRSALTVRDFLHA
ncbi:PucR family transcriptional regulator [Nocardia thailandica]